MRRCSLLLLVLLLPWPILASAAEPLAHASAAISTLSGEHAHGAARAAGAGELVVGTKSAGGGVRADGERHHGGISPHAGHAYRLRVPVAAAADPAVVGSGVLLSNADHPSHYATGPPPR